MPFTLAFNFDDNKQLCPNTNMTYNLGVQFTIYFFIEKTRAHDHYLELSKIQVAFLDFHWYSNSEYY